MLHTDARFAETIEKVVGEIEQETDVEVVVVAAPRSGSYREVPVLVGAGVAWLVLCFVLYSPFHFSGIWLPLELPIVGALAGWLANRSPWLIRRLTSQKRRRRQVEEAAHAAFFEEAIHGTRRRTGLLVYVSALEDRVVLLADGGIEAHIPGAAFNGLRWGVQQDPRAPGELDHFVRGLQDLGKVLSAWIPHKEGDNPNEISNAPRIRA